MKRKIKDVCGKHRRKDDFDDFDRDIDVFDLDEFDSEPEEVSSSKPVSPIPEEVPPEKSAAPAPAPKPAPKPAEKPAEEPAPVAEPAPVVRPEPKSAPRPAPKPAAKPAPAPSSSDDEPYRRPPMPKPTARRYPDTDQEIVRYVRRLRTKNADQGIGLFIDNDGRLIPVNPLNVSPDALDLIDIIYEEHHTPAIRTNVAPFWSFSAVIDGYQSLDSCLRLKGMGIKLGKLSLTSRNCQWFVLDRDNKPDYEATKSAPVTDEEMNAWEDSHIDLVEKIRRA